MKFVDDMTLAEPINVKECVLSNPDPNPPRPLAYRDRTLHVLPTDLCPMQLQLDRLVQYCQDHQMRINTETKVVLFNTARKYDFMPQLSIENDTLLDVVEEFKLLGLVFKSNLSWQANTDQMCKKAYARIWMLRRLKKLGASRIDMLDVYNKQIRCVLELAVSVWVPGLTLAENYQIERVQKCALYVIMGDSYNGYDETLIALEVEKLSGRRSKLCLKFAKRAEKHPKYQNWFVPADEFIPPTVTTRSDKTFVETKYKPVPTRTDRYKGSPLPFLTDILNEYYVRKK